MKIFNDRSLSNEIKELDLGIVEAGTEKEYKFYLFNETEALLDKLDITIDNSEVELKKYPSFLKSNESSDIVIVWRPSVTLKKGLKTTLKISGSELYY